jgi:hypothetical protein
MAEGAAESMHHRRAGSRCRHDGYYSGVGVYARDSQTLRYLLVCDDCGEEMKEISALDYVPRPVLAAWAT